MTETDLKTVSAQLATMAAKEIERLTAKTTLCTKEVLTCDEVALYMGVTKSQIYRLTMLGAIPHYKPTGKLCYFNRSEVEQWLQQNRCATAEEINDRVNRELMKGGAL